MQLQQQLEGLLPTKKLLDEAVSGLAQHATLSCEPSLATAQPNGFCASAFANQHDDEPRRLCSPEWHSQRDERDVFDEWSEAKCLKSAYRGRGSSVFTFLVGCAFQFWYVASPSPPSPSSSLLSTPHYLLKPFKTLSPSLPSVFDHQPPFTLLRPPAKKDDKFLNASTAMRKTPIIPSKGSKSL